MWFSTETFAGFQQEPFSMLLEMLVKGGLLLGVVWLIARFLRRAPAASRHLLWSAGMIGLALIPALAVTFPDWQKPIVAPNTTPTPTFQVEAGGSSTHAVAELPHGVVPPPPAVISDVVPSVISDAVSEPIADEVSTSWQGWVLALWALGGGIFLLPVVVGLLSLWYVARRSRRIHSGHLHETLTQLKDHLGIRRRIALLLSDRRQMPMTWGWIRPVILLPEEATSWPADRLQSVLLHELAHVQRWDYLTQLVVQFARALHWVNPLAWLAFNRVQAEQEASCDDVVLRNGQAPPDYAEHLLTVSVNLPSGSLAPSLAMVSSASPRIEQRLRSILDPTRNTRALGRREVLMTGIASLCLMLALGVLRLNFLQTSEPAVANPIESVEEKPETSDVLQNVWKVIRDNHVGRTQPKQLMQRAIHGIVGGLDDRYSAYLDPEQLERFDRQLDESKTGVGIWLREKDGQTIVFTPMDDSPAAMCKRIFPGDVLLEVDGKTTARKTLQEQVATIVGPVGTKVSLKVRHLDGKEETVQLERARFKMPTVVGYRRDSNGKWDYFLDAKKTVGYVAIRSFAANTAKDLRKVVIGLQRAGMEGMILDLRDCPGGLLDSAVQTSDLFLRKGTIVTIESSGKKDQRRLAKKEGTLGDFPLIVLINEHTASAGEIVVGALGENKRAVLIGARTFGKGSIQSLFKLDDGQGALKLTTSYYNLPSGRNIERSPGKAVWGIDPSEGNYVALTGKQVLSLRKVRENLRVLHPGKRQAKLEPLTARALATKYADPQLAGAFRSMLSKLNDGNFVRVGQANAKVLPLISKKQQLEEQKAKLRKNLERLEKDLEALDGLLEKQP